MSDSSDEEELVEPNVMAKSSIEVIKRSLDIRRSTQQERARDEIPMIKKDETPRPSRDVGRRILDDESNLRPSVDIKPKMSLDVARIYQEEKQRQQIKIASKKAKGKGWLQARKESKMEKKAAKRKSQIQIDEHKLSLKDLQARLDTNLDFDDVRNSKGLSDSEAKLRLARNGPNALTPAKTKPMWLKFLMQFLGFFPILLEAGGVLCLIAYGLDRSTPDNLYLGVILLLVVLVTAIFSFMQEAKSSSVMEGFKKLAPQNCKVHRDGKTFEIDASALVLGDIVEVKAGDKIPADLRLLWVHGLKVDNSSLTGESELQGRSEECTDENPLETKNLAFFTTLAQEGDGLGVVIRTGDNTVIGNIANLATSTGSDQTPLRKEVSRFIIIVSVAAISLGVIFFIIGFVVGLSPIANVVFVIGIIVANVPEGLLPTMTVGLTLTAKRLAKKKVLVKNLEAVETLGSCTTIASDKTGTLTQNKMTVVHVWYDGEIATCDEVKTKGSFDPQSPSFQALFRIATLCNRAVFDNSEENLALPVSDRKTIGDASESALLKFAEPLHSVMAFRSAHPKRVEIPFNSVNKWQLSIHSVPEEDGLLLVMKGAPERVVARCSTILIGGKEVEFTEEHRKGFQSAYETLAGHGERVLGFAHAKLDPRKFPEDHEFDLEKDDIPSEGLTFVGLMALMDPPRPSVPDAVAQCKLAGIRVIMVTGDHPLTAQAIAKQVGILPGETLNDIAQREGIPLFDVPVGAADGIVIKGSEIPELTEEQWDLVLSKKNIVFARTSPEQKLQIVENCQKRGEIVAVTGDGVNDSPALKKADLGCAMGISGSDVSKEAADVILLDDNFSSIVAGVREGRIIFDNLKKSINYTLSSNSAELVPFILFAVIRLPLALSAVLILCIDLGTDMVPSISLAYEKPESDIMKRKPRDAKKDRLVSLKLALFSYLWLGTIQAIAGFLAYFVTFAEYGLSPSDITGTSFKYFKRNADDFMGLTASQQIEILKEAQTAFFVAVVITRIGCALVCKTRKLSLFSRNILNNVVFDVGILVEVSLVILLTYVPFVEEVFSTRTVSYKIWLIGIPFLVFVVASDELRKFIIRRRPNGLVKRLTYW